MCTAERFPLAEQHQPTALGEVLKDYLKRTGLENTARYARISAVWESIVGEEIAAHTRVLGFRRGTLEIGVDSSALMSEIYFHRGALLQDLRARISNPHVERLFFRLEAASDE